MVCIWYYYLYITGVLILLIGKIQSPQFTDLIKYVINNHKAKTIIPVYHGVDRIQADQLTIAFSLSNLNAAYTEDENHLDLIHTGIKQEHSE